MTDLVTRFQGVPSEDAEVYYRNYVEAAPRRLDEFRREVAARGGPGQSLDFSPASLRPLWEWLLGELRRPEEPARDDEELPPWTDESDRNGSGPLSPASLRLVDGATYYFAESVLRAVPGSGWKLAHEPKIRSYANEGQPVIVGLRAELNPLWIVLGAAQLAAVDPSRRDPGRLAELFEYWARPPEE